VTTTSTTFLLLRHAQSAWNEQGRWQGRADPPLSDLGRRQARAAADRLGAVDVVVASPLERAHVTAEILADVNGIGPVVVDDDLVERDVSEWSGLTRAEIEAEWPGYLDEARRPPGWEDDDAVVARALAALLRLEAAYRGASVVVVTHGGLIGSLERHHGASGGRLANLSGRLVSHDGTTPSIGERLVLLDDDELTVPSQL
jgi:probable phosphoglycerate mutase